MLHHGVGQHPEERALLQVKMTPLFWARDLVVGTGGAGWHWAGTDKGRLEVMLMAATTASILVPEVLMLGGSGRTEPEGARG